MASLIIFLCFSAFMFVAGYQWRAMKEDHGRRSQPDGPATPRPAIWDGMVGKI